MDALEKKLAADAFEQQLRWTRSHVLQVVEAAEKLHDKAAIVRARALRDVALPRIEAMEAAQAVRRETPSSEV